MAKTILSFIVVLCLLHSVSSILPGQFSFYKQFFLPYPAFGPDSVGFAQNDQGTAYVSISDGRVLKLSIDTGTFVDFAYTSPLRNKQQCDGNVNSSLSPTCGKVFALSVDNKNMILYLVDVNLGLFSVSLSQGGQATLITNTAGGEPLKLSISIDVDPISSDVYFTDASQTLDYRNITPSAAGVALDSTGRLIRYSPATRQVTVLLSELAFPSGPAVSFDGTFVLIPQAGARNIIKYYIRGPRTSETEVLLPNLPGVVAKIKRASLPGVFWVAVNEVVGSVNKPSGYRFDSLGNVLLKKDLSPQYPNIVTLAIQETNPFTIYVGSRLTNYITQYYY